MSELESLRAEVQRQRTWIERLCRALETHTRTDLAPDAALPEMQRLREEVETSERVV